MLSKKELQELVQANIITDEISNKIEQYYQKNSSNGLNKLFVVFGILGATLVGLGIILIVAHNWDQLSKFSKTLLAFFPLTIGHLTGLYILLKKYQSSAWREGIGVFIFFSVATAIALISQIYNIPGEINTFIFTWMLLSLPLIYLFQSAMVSLFYLIGITYYAVNMGYWNYPDLQPYYYWLLLLGILPFYYWLCINKKNSNFTFFHHWFIPLSIIISLGTLATNQGILLNVSYMSLFGIFTLIGKKSYFQTNKTRNNGYLVLGHLGTIILMLILSFKWVWQDLATRQWNDYFNSQEFIVSIMLNVVGIYLSVLHFRKNQFSIREPFDYMFLIFNFVFIFGLFSSSIGIFSTNLLLFSMGVLVLLEGDRKNHLGLLNFGLLIIAAQLISRFFDSNLSFIIRGILFISVGVGFFLTNYRMLQKRKDIQNQKLNQKNL